MSIAMTVPPLEELEPNLVCAAAENVKNSVFLNNFNVLYFLVEGKYTSWKGEELMQSDIYNPVRWNTNDIQFH